MSEDREPIKDTSAARPEFKASYIRLMVAALSKLRNQGYAVLGEEDEDIIHSFFVSRWNALVEGFDPGRGKFESYLFTAFIRYARRMAVADYKNRMILQSMGSVDFDERQSNQSAGETYDMNVLVRSFNDLDDFYKKILRMRFVEGYSERDLSEEMGISRYQVREVSVAALAMLAANMGEPGALTKEEWEVVRGLWSEQRTEQELASSLQITTHQLNQLKKSALQRFGAVFAR